MTQQDFGITTQEEEENETDVISHLFTSREIITNEIRSCIYVNTLFERLSKLRRQARFEDPRSNTRATGSNNIPVRSDRRVNELSENSSRREQIQPQTQATPSPSGSGDGSSNVSRQTSAGSPVIQRG